jgi:hypothetical protein
MTPKSVSMVFGLLDYQYLKRSRLANGPPGPPYIRLGRCVFYDKEEVISFIQGLRQEKS